MRLIKRAASVACYATAFTAAIFCGWILNVLFVGQ